MKIMHWFWFCLPFLLLGCATNSSGDQAQELTEQLDTNVVSETVSEPQPEIDNSFGSVNFFRRFAAEVNSDAVQTLQTYFSTDEARTYASEMMGVEKNTVFIDTPWSKILPSANNQMMKELGQLGAWAFIDSQAEGNYLHSYFFLDSENGFDYVDIVWVREGKSIVDIKQMFFKYGVTEILVELDRVYDSDAYTLGQKHAFVRAVSSVAENDIDRFKKQFLYLPDDLRNHDVLIERVLKGASADASGKWLQVIAENWAESTEIHSNFYGYYSAVEAYDKAFLALETIPEPLYEHAALLSERAAVLWQKGELEQANHFANESILKSPYLDMPYYLKLMISLEREDYEGVLLTLQVLKERFEIEYLEEGLMTLEGGEKFLQSRYAKAYFG